jgi:hypothetical protein
MGDVIFSLLRNNALHEKDNDWIGFARAFLVKSLFLTAESIDRWRRSSLAQLDMVLRQ